MVDPNRKEPDLYFKVVDPKLQVADLKAEVGELRSSGIPQFNPWIGVYVGNARVTVVQNSKWRRPPSYIVQHVIVSGICADICPLDISPGQFE